MISSFADEAALNGSGVFPRPPSKSDSRGSCHPVESTQLRSSYLDYLYDSRSTI